MAFVIIARGDGRAYILTELSSAAIYLALSIPAYRYGGFAALGLAYVLWYGAYCAITCAVCLRRYGMRLRGSSLRLLLGTVGVAIACLLLCELIGNWLTLAITLPPPPGSPTKTSSAANAQCTGVGTCFWHVGVNMLTTRHTCQRHVPTTTSQNKAQKRRSRILMRNPTRIVGGGLIERQNFGEAM
ncbi:MAG: hypothetical protein HDS72_00310 [Bacteroidales bacterium]|nr:hypothetical protein [Bacteroidales bacterium]